MEEKSYLIAHIKDLVEQAKRFGYITSTTFLSLSEQALFLKECQQLIKDNKDELDFIFSDFNDSDRKVLFIKPKFLDEEILKEYENSYITSLYFKAKNSKYSDALSHRDVLGALMNIGIKRDTIGDIIINHDKKDEGIIFIISSVKEFIIDNLTKIKHTDILIEEVDKNEITIKPHFGIKEIYSSSLRIDTIIKEVFNLSRNEAQELIEKEFVFINGNTIHSLTYNVKENDRVSVKSKGKFIFLKVLYVNKKNKLRSEVKIYS